MATHDTSDTTATAFHVWGDRVRDFADRVAFHYRRNGAWQSLTWRQADDAAREIAAGLCSLGLRAGQRVVVLCQTRLEWVLSDVAIAMAGLVSVPIYPSTTAAQCEVLIGDSGASAALVENADQAAKLAPLAAKRPDFHLVAIEEDTPGVGGESPGLSLAGLRRAGVAWAKAYPDELDRRAMTVLPSDSFTIIYTSGTTGQPKGVVLTHANLVASCASAVRAFDLRPTDVQYLFLPLAHVLGREVEWAPIIVGSQVAFSEGLARIKFDLVEVRPTFMAGVPRIFEKLYAAVQAGAQQGGRAKRALVRWAFGVAAEYSGAMRTGKAVSPGLRLSRGLADKLVLRKLRKRLGLDRCRFLISGGAPLASEIAEFFHGAGLLILEGYGLTESTAAAFVNRFDRYRFGTVGPAIDVVEAKLADDGEILLRGPSIFSSYHNNPTATAEVFDAEGWFHTGDIGVMEDEFLRIVDRKKDIIITAGGKNVAPQKLENALKAHTPLVSQVVVFGDRRSYCVALITPSEPAARQFGGGDLAAAAASPALRAAIERAVAEVNGALASYETIKSFALLPADFSEATGELTPSLKVKRDVVASKFATAVAGLYGE
ncbi:MAG: long-chain fatty acid--CoA ligase [Deltaproteobacteria bacterium]|nr:long-chain fatty acid--CoA ligase [Deltaproteobacteria bacterium]